MKKSFEVIINDKPYDVWNIDGKEHNAWNGEPKNWWVYYSDRLPEELTPPIDSENWVPFSYSLNRTLWEITYKQTNSSKYKWNETQFSNHGHCEMKCNGKLIYSFPARTLEFGLAKAQYLTVALFENFGFDFFDPQSNHGRKIWWMGLPATVRVSSKSTPWEIGIVPDYSTGVDKKTWWKEFKNRRSNLGEVKDENDIDVFDEEDDYRDYINWGDAFNDKYIDWYRK